MKEPDILATWFVNAGTPGASIVFWYISRETFDARKGTISKSEAVPWPGTTKEELQRSLAQAHKAFESRFPGEWVSMLDWRSFWIFLRNAGFVEEQS